MAVPGSEPATLQTMVTSLGSTEADALIVMDALFQQCFKEQIHALADGLTKKGFTKQYDKVLQRVGRLQENTHERPSTTPLR